MESYPKVFIFGRKVNGVFLEYHGDGSCHSFELAERARDHLNAWNTKSGQWEILQYGRPKPLMSELGRIASL